MRILITGATGNVGTALVRALIADQRVDEIVGVARRLPEWKPAGVRWVRADIARDDLVPHMVDVDAVVHLAWLIQPSRSRKITHAVNVGGAGRVFDAVARAEIPTLVHASSVAAYSAGHGMTAVDESWATDGIASSYYSQQKVAVERLLDRFERANPATRVVRLRPGLIFQHANAPQIRRFFAGPLVPGWAARPGLIPVMPDVPGLSGQVVHADDVAEAYRLAVLDPDARGAYNVAADPALDTAALAQLLEARPVRVPARVVRAALTATWRARLQPVSPDWLDLGRGAPVMSTARLREQLGWNPVHDAAQVVDELLLGLRDAEGFPTPPLAPHAGGVLRLREFLSGVGGPTPLDRRSAR